MNHFNYLKITKTRKIRYLKHIKKNGPYIVFLHGFMSDLEGKKPKEFYNFAKKKIKKFRDLIRIAFITMKKCGKAMGHSPINVSLTHLRGLEVPELTEGDMPMI